MGQKLISTLDESINGLQHVSHINPIWNVENEDEDKYVALHEAESYSTRGLSENNEGLIPVETDGTGIDAPDVQW